MTVFTGILAFTYEWIISRYPSAGGIATVVLWIALLLYLALTFWREYELAKAKKSPDG
jgi:hypothetical protein